MRQSLLLLAAYGLYGASRWLVTGDRELAVRHARSLLDFERGLGHRTVVSALNFAAQERQLPNAFRGVPLLSSDPQLTEDAAGSPLRLAPHEGVVLAAP